MRHQNATQTFFISIISCILLTSCITGGFNQPLPAPIIASLDLSLFDELSPVFPDQLPQDQLNELTTFSEEESGFLISADIPQSELKTPQLTIEFQSTNNQYPIPEITLFECIAVPVEFNTGIIARTECIDGLKNPYVIRRAPFYIYEVLKPLILEKKNNNPTAFYEIPNRGRNLFFIRLKQPKIDNYSEIDLNIKLSDASQVIEKSLKIKRYPVSLNENKAMDYIVWHNNQNIAAEAETELYTEKWFNELDKYAQLMKQGRQNAFIVPWELMFEENLETPLAPRLMTDRLNRYLNLFFNHGMMNPASFSFASRTNGNWNATSLTVQKKWLASSPEAEIYLTNCFSLLKEYIESKNLTERWKISISDEPSRLHSSDYKILAKIVKSVIPNCPILEATKGRESLVGAVDFWCPTVNEYELHKDFFDERQIAGDDIWVYTCLDPGGPWLNRLLDQEKLRQVYFGWAAAKFNVTGYLHWGLNWYRQDIDPFKQSVVAFHSAGGPQSQHNQLPAGDSHIVYPGEKGPLGTLRLNAMKIGMEDYILLQMLKQQNHQESSLIINELVKGYKEYSTNIKNYRIKREEILIELSL